MKYLFTLISILFTLLLNATTLEVALDGTQQYTSIQAAINVAQNGDTILVHPGRYYENINYNSKSLIIASLHYNTQDESYIGNTIIDGNQTGGCVTIYGGDFPIESTLHGFTVTNGGENLTLDDLPHGLIGAGVCVDSGHLPDFENRIRFHLEYCIIKENYGYGGTGLTNWFSYVYLKKTSIHNNYSYSTDGGILSINGMFEFDPIEKCSIYNNNGILFHDFSHVNYSGEEDLHVIVDTFTVNIEEQDYAYFGSNVNVTMHYDHYIYDQIESNLYVSPDGDDSNSGTSWSEPLQTINWAMRKIKADSLHHRTVYLAPGTYSKSENNQLFPFCVPRYVSLIGEDQETTILDAEDGPGFMNLAGYTSDIIIKNITFQNVQNLSKGTSMIGADSIENLTFENITIQDSYGYGDVGMVLFNSSVTLKNFTYKNLYPYMLGQGALFASDSKLEMKTIIVDGIQCYGAPSEINAIIGMSLVDCDVEMDNLVVKNCKTYSNTLIQIQNSLEYGSPENRSIVRNSLFYNNEINEGWENPSLLKSVNDTNPTVLTNSTFVNNYGTAILGVALRHAATLENNIFYNPELMHELTFLAGVYGEDHSIENPEFLFRNNLIRDMDNSIQYIYGYYNSEFVWDGGNIDADPLFVGGDPLFDSSYQLSPASPCINAGTQDTLGLNLLPYDLAGNYRVWDDRIDIGCYEFGADHYVSNDEPEIVETPTIRIKNYPNPFSNSTHTRNSGTTIQMLLPFPIRDEGMVEIFNVRGQKIKEIPVYGNGRYFPNKNGQYEYAVRWNGKNRAQQTVSSGVYLYRFVIDGKSFASNKCLILK